MDVRPLTARSSTGAIAASAQPTRRMCGIAGLLALDGFAARHGTASPVDARRSRAPWARRSSSGSARKAGSASIPRLAIIDLSDRADQPIANEEATCGSLPTARSTSTRRSATSSNRPSGHRFTTDHADSEVIVHAFEEKSLVRSRAVRHVRDRRLGRRDGRLWLGATGSASRSRSTTRHTGASCSQSRTRRSSRDRESRRGREAALYHYLTFLAAPPTGGAVPRRGLPAANGFLLDQSGAMPGAVLGRLGSRRAAWDLGGRDRGAASMSALS